MSDLMDKLKRLANMAVFQIPANEEFRDTILEAQDEIEQLRDEIEDLHEAIDLLKEQIAGMDDDV